MKKNTKQKTSINNQRDSEENYSSIINAINEAVLIFNIDTGKVLDANRAMLEMYEMSYESILNASIYELDLGESPLPRMKFHCPIRKAHEEGHSMLELCARKKMGESFWVKVTLKCVVINKEEYYMAVIRDITELKMAEERIKISQQERKILLKEINHRVFNNLQIILSLTNLQSIYIKDERVLEQFRENSSRIYAISQIHESLYKSENLGIVDINEYLQGLKQELLSFYETGPAEINLEIDVNNIFLSIDNAIPIALIINELLHNSFKYAFLEGGKGKIDIKSNHCNDDYYSLTVSDNGKGLPDGFDLKQIDTLGLYLVNLLTKQLRGSIKLDNKNGTCFTILFPKQK